MKKKFLPSAKIALVLVYSVIVAGALVRMTGSGMGCPDWPKCFGYYIPPTDVEELTWRPNKTFEKGQVIVKDEALWVANADFTTAEQFNESHWRPYTKHDYAIFNPTHTWIEYLNRLCGALAGIAVFIMAVYSLAWRKSKARITALSWLTVFLMGFQAWLGATVVYSVLNPVKITLHMVVALVIVALMLYIIRTASGTGSEKKYDPLFTKMLWGALFLSLTQVVIGTQVRQFVDMQVKNLGYDNMAAVLSNPDWDFYLHRTFSFVVLFFNVWLYLRNRRLVLGYKKLDWVLGLIGLEIATGIAMYYFDFPFGSQAAHLVLASALFGVQFYLVLEARAAKKQL
ncbi:COX15/CtaA family protein [Flavobacterium caeni]|uniref:Cytochrome c oxidase assembly protein subunit 15 n=1 Tax=Flavobacterium caeni TaxID=490189 RepID=A0A1G5AUZ3_9FLAO|nr:COX15/CtaA family protein [Flavobacterium caeni]SCX81735.1 cytochrome c oxidase assembly protein subunit 15 [Flavobacterium caeni]